MCAVHAPCLLFTQRVWGTEPWGKLERSAEMAAAVGAEVVVVHPPFRWQRTTPRDFVDGIAALEESTGIAFAVENMYPWRASASARRMEMYLPGWDPSDASPTPTPRSTSPTRRSRSADAVEMAERLGDRLRHIHLTDGTGSAKDEHLVPGRGAMGAADFLRPPGRPGFAGDVVLEINTRKRCTTRERARGRPARVAGVRPRALRGAGALTRREPRRRARRAPPRPPARARPTPGRRSSTAARARFAARRLRGYDDPRGRRATPGSTPALVHHYFGTKDDLFLAALELPVDPREVLAAGARRAASTGRRSGCSRVFLSVWDDPELQPPLLARGPRRSWSPPAPSCCPRGVPPGGARPVGRGARHRPARAPDAAGRQPDDRPDPGPLRARVEPLASLPAEQVVATYAPTIQRYLTGPLP